MKALIVDDEKHVRDAIRILVDWESYGIKEIFEASEGSTAIQIIKAQHPEIIFTDMLMPIVSGSELLEWIHQHAKSSKTIVISGHDDFGYVRHTIKHGGMDYILKPIDENQLNDALRKAVDATTTEKLLLTKNQDQNIKMNQIKPIYWDKVMSNLIEDPRIYPTLSQELQTEFLISHHNQQARVVILTLETMQKRIKDKFASNLDLLCYSVTNIANEFLRKGKAGYAFRNWGQTNELVIIVWRNVDTTPRLIHEINEGIYVTYGVRFDFGIGTACSFPMELPISYKEANTALKQRNLLQKGNRIHIFTADDHSRMNTIFFSTHQEAIRLAILSNNQEQIHSAIDGWFQDVRSLQAISTEQLDLWTHEFTIFRSRLLKDHLLANHTSELSQLGSSVFIIPVDAEGRISISLWQEEFTQHMLTLSNYLSDSYTKSNNIILEIAEYIQEHYQADITLQHIAERYFLSREYISRKFKQEMNENISDFIGRTRIENAKLLLLNPQLRMAQISEMVGYQDEKYFSKVFKKMVGLSPNQYRKQSHHEHN